jgi:beta-galactosidase
MANTSIAKFDTYLAAVLRYADNTGSVNLYMAFGGTNFGWTAGECSSH